MISFNFKCCRSFYQQLPFCVVSSWRELLHWRWCRDRREAGNTYPMPPLPYLAYVAGLQIKVQCGSWGSDRAYCGPSSNPGLPTCIQPQTTTNDIRSTCSKIRSTSKLQGWMVIFPIFMEFDLRWPFVWGNVSQWLGVWLFRTSQVPKQEGATERWLQCLLCKFLGWGEIAGRGQKHVKAPKQRTNFCENRQEPTKYED